MVLFRSLSPAATAANLLLSAMTTSATPQQDPLLPTFQHAQNQPHLPSVHPAADPVLIDPAGVYLRATPLRTNTSSGAAGILVGYTTHTPTLTTLRVARSLDSARSWHPLPDVWQVPRDAHDVDNAMPLQLPSGRILYAFRNHDRDAAGAYTRFRITVCASDDGGGSWRFLSHVEDRAPYGAFSGVWEPFLRVGRGGGGEVQVYYSSEKGGEQENLVRMSRDGGETWGAPGVVSEGRRSRDGMVGVAEVDGRGTLICVFEGTELGPFSVMSVTSRDDGRTWGERARVYVAGGGRHAGAPQVHNVGGALVVSFMTNEGTVDVGQLDGGQMKVVTSVDGGRTWSSGGGRADGTSNGATVTADIGAHWPGMYTLDDEHFLALYSKDGIGAVSQVYRLV
ncbi:glycoside hydrolase [Podospora conica]|nr:glycoside hydrolase [Schizothecium conicum]